MSKSIYKKHNYVYEITEISTDRKYIGVRSCNIDPMDDLMKYKSSSLNNEFERRQKDQPEDYRYEILSFHNNREDAVKEEIRLHELYDVAKNPKFINRAKQTSTGFDGTGMIVVKDINGNIFWVGKDDPRYISGELSFIKTGNKLTEDTKNKISKSLKGHIISESTKQKISITSKGNNNPMFGKIVIVENGKNIIVDKDDIRILSNEFKSPLTGENNGMYRKKHTESAKKKMSIARSGANNASAKSVVINNIIYTTIKEAATKLNLARNTIKSRCKSDKDIWIGWYYK